MAPSGARDGCPLCRTALAATPSSPIAERRCPRCEAGLWAIALPSGSVYYVRRPDQSVEEFVAALAGPVLGTSAEDIARFLRCADSLDLVEFLEELEAATGPLGHRTVD
jgi:hypothetical protein